MSWEGLAGINYFSALSSVSIHRMKYYGFLTATELLDPPHYVRLLRGMNRIQGAYPLNIKYYIAHHTDRRQNASWIEKIILPIFEKSSQFQSDFWLGFYLRLDSAQRYYDYALQLLTQLQAA
jgi:hypothetical protein